MTRLFNCWCGAAVVHVEGRLRVPVNSDVRRAVRGLLNRGERRIVVDLAALSDVDAAGIGELVRMFNMARAARGTLHVARAPKRVRRVLEVVGLTRLLDAHSHRGAESDCHSHERKGELCET